MTRVVVCCGVGGVGKTTAAAALAVAHAIAGQRAVVLTIDPARRLADALGIAELGNDAVPVNLTSIGASGTLHAMMLDRKATFDQLVRRHAGDEATAERLLINPYYLAASTRLTGSHEYMAAVKLEELVTDGRWDVVVVDTPPAQHAVEFFHAPERMGRLFDQGTLGALAGGGGLFGVATRQVGRVLERIAGEATIRDISEFFRLSASMSGALRERSAKVDAVLHSEQTALHLITPPRTDSMADVSGFADLLRVERLHLSGLIANRVVLAPRLGASIDRKRLPDRPGDVDSGDWEELSDALVDLPARVDALAREQTEACSRLSSAAGGAPVAVLPEIPGGVRTLEALARLAPFLPILR